MKKLFYLLLITIFASCLLFSCVKDEEKIDYLDGLSRLELLILQNSMDNITLFKGYGNMSEIATESFKQEALKLGLNCSFSKDFEVSFTDLDKNPVYTYWKECELSAMLPTIDQSQLLFVAVGKKSFTAVADQSSHEYYEFYVERLLKGGFSRKIEGYDIFGNDKNVTVYTAFDYEVLTVKAVID